MSPKYIINWKDMKSEGPPAQAGGKNPKWGKQHKFSVGDDLTTAGVMNFTFLEADAQIC